MSPVMSDTSSILILHRDIWHQSAPIAYKSSVTSDVSPFLLSTGSQLSLTALSCCLHIFCLPVFFFDSASAASPKLFYTVLVARYCALMTCPLRGHRSLSTPLWCAKPLTLMNLSSARLQVAFTLLCGTSDFFSLSPVTSDSSAHDNSAHLVMPGSSVHLLSGFILRVIQF